MALRLPPRDRSWAGVCEVRAEVAKVHGQSIEGLAFGESTFNFCFPAGRELEAVIGTPRTAGRPCLTPESMECQLVTSTFLADRVFWEQW